MTLIDYSTIGCMVHAHTNNYYDNRCITYHVMHNNKLICLSLIPGPFHCRVIILSSQTFGCHDYKNSHNAYKQHAFTYTLTCSQPKNYTNHFSIPQAGILLKDFTDRWSIILDPLSSLIVSSIH